MSNFPEQLAEAKSIADPDVYIDRVKAAVRDELVRLDPTAKVEDTHYFNHSVVPDFVFSWSKEKEKRYIYLRDSYASVVAAEELLTLESSAPVILSLSSQTEFPSERFSVDFRRMRDDMGETSRTLLTDSSAVSEIDARPTVRDDISPVQELIRANFVRGARGVVTPRLAHELVGIDRPKIRFETEMVAARFARVFSPEVAREITRAAQLVAIATAQNPHEILDANSFTLDRSVQFSTMELQHILPWLLESPDVTLDPRFWRYIGSMMDLSDLESLRDRLSGKDLTPLVSANLHTWVASRAFLGLAQYPHEEEEEEDQQIAAMATEGWSFIGGAIGVNVEDKRLYISTNGRTLRGRDSVSAALWDEIKPALMEFKLSTVRLSGIARTITIDAEQSDNIKDDVEEIVRSVEDTYYINEVRIRFNDPRNDEPVETRVKLGASLVVAEDSVSLFDLANAALSILSYRNPLSRIFANSPAAGGSSL